MLVGICQTNIIFENKIPNLMEAEQFVARCANKGAKICFFPEMSMTGFTMNAEEFCEKEDGITYTTMSDYARKYNICIGYGYISKKEKGFYNTYAIVDNTGRVILNYDKIHPFSYGKEDEFYEKGDKLYYCEIDGITICPVICYELRFPELFIKASRKAELIVVPANFGGARDYHWNILLPARAVESQVYVAGINRCGEDTETYYKGHSMVVDPKGNIIAKADDEPDVIFAEIDKTVVDEYKKEFPVWKDHRPEIYENL